MPISEALGQEGIRYRFSPAGTTLYVDSRRGIDARLTVVRIRAETGQQFTFADALGAEGMGTTETTRREMLRRSHEADVVAMMRNFGGVSGAQVIILTPETTRLALPNQPPATAAISLVTYRNISPTEGRIMALMVQASVAGLELENITIADQNHNPIFLGSDQEMVNARGGIEEARAAEHSRLERSIRSLLAQVFPGGGVGVAANLVFPERVFEEIWETSFAAADGTDDGLVLREVVERAEVEGLLPGGLPPGIDANIQQFPNYAIGPGQTGSADHRRHELDRIFDEIRSHVQTVGATEYLRDQSSITVTLIRGIEHNQDSWIRRNPGSTEYDWVDFRDEMVLSTSEPLEDHAILAIAPGMIQTATGMSPDSITVVMFDLHTFVNTEPSAIHIPTIIMLVVLVLLLAMLAFALLRRQRQAEIEEDEFEPELSVEDLLVSTQLEEQREEAEKLKDIETLEDSEIKKLIEKFVNEKPDAVASLLRNWLNAEEW
jgi:flagellar M-ring protein FliF